ncbi:DUF969 domain-containing protein [Fluviispira vulneris]|uniref:DUF969 domain-containing protein n=1 Tax=Fluviispira vulneris TaxID=2763012 RepID=UPI001647634E|nr:DUF969 domain-containing protein [Fluviispira vulneris]
MSLLLPLIGIPIIILGFALRFNPLLVIATAGIVTGFSVGMDFFTILETFGEKFLNSRQLAVFILILPVVGLLEHYGLKERAEIWIGKFTHITTGKIIMLYFFLREISAAMGLIGLGGHAQTIRPLIAPMAEGASKNKYGPLPKSILDKIRSHAAASENIAVFFGEDIFIAFGAIILMNTFLNDNGIENIEPLHIGLWGIPTAICALCIHLIRLTQLDTSIKNDVRKWKMKQGDLD